MSSDRYSGFLTPDDREWLNDDERQETGERARRIRRGIRERAGRALRDFALLESKLPDTNDPGGIFGSFGGLWTDEGLSHYPMRDVIAFLYRASLQHDYSAKDWQRWLKRAIRRVQPAAFIGVEIHVFQDHQIDQIHDQYESDPEEFKKSSDAMHRRALIQEGLVPPEEFDDVAPIRYTAFPRDED